MCFQIASELEDGYKVENAHYLQLKQQIDQRFSFFVQLVTVSEAVNLLQQSKRPSDHSTIVNSEVLVIIKLKHE